MSRKRIEDIFNETLGNEQEAYQQGDWEQMSRMLDAGKPPVKEKRRRRWFFFLLPFVLLCSIWLLWNNIKNNKEEAQAATKPVAQGENGGWKTTPDIN